MNKIILLIIVAVLLSSCREQAVETGKQEAELMKIRVARVASDSLSIPIRGVGSLASKTQSNLSFLTGGIIDRIYVNEGDLVKKGDLLARLEMTEIESRLNQARLAYEKAQRDFERIENLYRDTVVTLEQYQDARTGLELAGSNLRIARYNKKNSRIEAPSDGKILKKLKEVNEITAPGHPVIVFASTETDWVLNVNLSDRDIVRVMVGDTAKIHFDAYPGEEFLAEVREVASAANLMSGTYEVELALLELPERLVSGLIGKAKIQPAAETYLFLPPEALVEAIGNQGTVFVLDGERVMRTRIELAAVTSRGIIIKSGIKAGQQVVTDGNSWIKDGEKVIVVE